jgi:hypothetical protein
MAAMRACLVWCRRLACRALPQLVLDMHILAPQKEQRCGGRGGITGREAVWGSVVVSLKLLCHDGGRQPFSCLHFPLQACMHLAKIKVQVHSRARRVPPPLT